MSFLILNFELFHARTNTMGLACNFMKLDPALPF